MSATIFQIWSRRADYEKITFAEGCKPITNVEIFRMNNNSIYLVSGLFPVRYSARDCAVVFLLLYDNKMPQQKLPSWRSFLTVEPVIMYYFMHTAS